MALLDTTRVTTELGWSPRRSSIEALNEVIEGIAAGAGAETPRLALSRPDTAGLPRSGR